MDNITVSELQKLISKVNLIDIRDNYQFNLGTIPTARNIPYAFIIINPENYLDKNQRYYIFCEQGEASRRACLVLAKKGYDVVNVLGGYSEFRRLNNIN